MEFHRFSLSNDIRVVAAPMMPYAPVALQIFFSCGSRTEKIEEHGLAHFNEHMFFRGGRDFPDAGKVEAELGLLGDKNGAGTSDEFVLYFIVVSPRSIERAVHLISDMLVYGRMDPTDLEKERGPILQEFRRLVDDPEEYSSREFKRMMFGEHPLGRNIVGTEEAISRISAGDVLRYKDRFYGPPNAVISIAGGIDYAVTRELLERYFGGIPQKESVSWLPFHGVSVAPPAELRVRKGVAQAHVYVGSIAPSYSDAGKDRVLQILRGILNSRLYLKVRADHSLAYSVYASIWLFKDTGLFYTYAGVDAKEAHITEAASLILEEMQIIKSGDVTEEEVEAERTSFHSKIDLEFESSSSVAMFVGGHELLLGKAKSLDVVHAEIESVTHGMVLDMAREIWREEAVRSFLLTASFPGYERKFCELRKVLR